MVGSKGCGANMRVTPVGLLDVDLDTLAGLAQLQAGLTHGHPTGLAASELTAYAVRLLIDGVALAELPDLLAARARDQRTVYRADWLGDLWQRSGAAHPRGVHRHRLGRVRRRVAPADRGARRTRRRRRPVPAHR